jgi:hypothetical protein
MSGSHNNKDNKRYSVALRKTPPVSDEVGKYDVMASSDEDDDESDKGDDDHDDEDDSPDISGTLTSRMSNDNNQRTRRSNSTACDFSCRQNTVICFYDVCANLPGFPHSHALSCTRSDSILQKKLNIFSDR